MSEMWKLSVMLFVATVLLLVSSAEPALAQTASDAMSGTTPTAAEAEAFLPKG